jgi:hypothetical protein
VPALACSAAVPRVCRSAAHREPRVEVPAAAVPYYSALDFADLVVDSLEAALVCPWAAHRGPPVADAVDSCCLQVDSGSPAGFRSAD